MSKGVDARKSKIWLWGSIVSALVPWAGSLWIRYVYESYPIETVVYQTGEVNRNIGQMSGVLALVCVLSLAVIVAALFLVTGRSKLVAVVALISTLYVGYTAWFSYSLLMG